MRYCIATGHRVPSVTLYTERQLCELKSFCFNGCDDSVLGFDKTYNVGLMHVTVSIYKNIALYRRRSTEHPLFIGPLFVHGHSDTDTYNFFFSHLTSRLSDRPCHLLASALTKSTASGSARIRLFSRCCVCHVIVT